MISLSKKKREVTDPRMERLLKILLKQLPWQMIVKGCGGLCCAIHNLGLNLTFTNSEEKDVSRYIDMHRPKESYGYSYWWKRGRLLPRRRFLRKLLKTV